MTTPTAADLKPARLRLWSNWLWLLAGLLGIAVLWSAVRLIHDQGIRREALRSLAQDKATEIATLGAARFNLLVADALGEAWTSRARQSGVAQRLAGAHRERLACHCRETLPVVRFFHFDASTGAPYTPESRRLETAAIDSAGSVADTTLMRIAVAQWNAGMAQTKPVTNVEVAGRFAVVSVTRPSDAGGGTDVYGAVVPVAELAAALFGAIPLATPEPGIAPRPVTAPVFVHGGPMASIHAGHMAEHRRLVQLDTLGLGIVADSQAVFGSVAARPYTATATLPPPLQKFHVNVAMMGSQVSMPLLMPFSLDRLWLNGILVLATIVVCLFAIGSSRREVALARARSDFIAGVSHDLRMPLAQILLAGETLSLGRARSDAERSTLTSSILREGRRLKAMIENVLLFSRAGAVGVEPHLQQVDLRSLLEAVEQSTSLAVADAGQRIAIDAGHDAQAMTDRSLMHQAIVNLVDNAMKYGPPGQTIRLGAGRAGARVTISVADEGPGIPQSARDRLFEPYERLDRDRSSERTGSGLGLAVVRQVVLACGGSVQLVDVDRGTTVEILLPAAT